MSGSLDFGKEYREKGIDTPVRERKNQGKSATSGVRVNDLMTGSMQVAVIKSKVPLIMVFANTTS
jgi:hypothetical protein